MYCQVPHFVVEIFVRIRLQCSYGKSIQDDVSFTQVSTKLAICSSFVACNFPNVITPHVPCRWSYQKFVGEATARLKDEKVFFCFHLR